MIQASSIHGDEMNSPTAAFLLSALASGASGIVAQQITGIADPPAEGTLGGAPRTEITGPAPPIAPAVINQTGETGVTVRATRITEPMEVDGALAEPFYQRTRAITELIQSIPDPGEAPTEVTEVWLGFDEENIYVGARVWDSEGPDAVIANEMRRDSPQIRQNDNFGIFLDTFHDQRNAVAFYTNALGALTDYQIDNEGRPNRDWNPIWEVETEWFEGGWTVEMAIPFRSIRYRPGREQVWGIQMRPDRMAAKRVEPPHVAPPLGRAPRRALLKPRLAVRNPGRDRGAGPKPGDRSEALWHLGASNGPGDRARDPRRWLRRCRP